MRYWVFFVIALCAAAPAAAQACWESAAQRYGVSAQLLYAVAQTESGLNPRAVNRSHVARTGTYDIGLMQINSGHLSRLARFGISEQDLFEPCVNLNVGAWLLATTFSKHGVTWEGIGAYNAACSQLKGDACAAARSRYAWRVFEHLPERQAAQRVVRQQQHAHVAETEASQPVSYILSAKVSP